MKEHYLMKTFRNFVAIAALSTSSLFANDHAEAAKAEAPESRVEHLLEAANHLEAAGAAREAESIRAHVKVMQSAHEATAEKADAKPKAKKPTAKIGASVGEPVTKKAAAEGEACCPASRAAALKATTVKQDHSHDGHGHSHVKAGGDCTDCTKTATASAEGDCKSCTKTATASTEGDCKGCTKTATASAEGDCKDCEGCEGETATVSTESDELLKRLSDIESTLDAILKKMN